MDNASKLFRARRVVWEMLTDRGYLVPQAEAKADLNDFKGRFGEEPRRDDLTINVSKHDDPNDQIFVFFLEDTKVGVKELKTLLDRMKTENVARAILILPKALTSFAKQGLAAMQPRYYMEQFSESEMLVNITKHVLVPVHRILNPDEKKTLLNRYKVKDTQLPRIQFTDPVARYYGAKKGDVFRIVRPSETAGRYVTYRLCV